MSNSSVAWKPGSGASKTSKTSNSSKHSGALMKFFSIALGVLVAFGVALYIFVVRPLQAVAKDVYALRDSVYMVKSGFINRDLIEMRKGFDAVESSMEALRASRDAHFGWVTRMGFLKPYYDDSNAALDAGSHLVQAGREVATLSEPFADAIGLRVSEDQAPSQLSLLDAVASWVSIMPDIAQDVDSVIKELSLAGESLQQIDPNRYPEKIGDFVVRANLKKAQNTLSSLTLAAPDIKQALIVIPNLLGVGGKELRYMIIMQNDKELRPTGGFWTNYATFKVKNAMLNSDFSSKDMYSIDMALEAIDSWYDFPDAPPAYAKYLKVQHLYARDANYSPDYPTSVAKFMTFYKQAIPLRPDEIKPVDGVIAIDTVVLEELMDITGPVTVSGFTYTSDNVVLALERLASLALREQAGRKAVLGKLMQAMLINVFESENNLWPSLIEKGIDLASRKHILVYMNDPEAQRLLEAYNFAGQVLPTESGEDYAFVVSTNLAGDKTNWFVRKAVTHTLLKDGTHWVKDVKITYTYDQPSPEYAPFVKRYQDWLRLYVPEGSELLSSDGFEYSFGGGNELGKTYFDGFLGLGPGEVKTVEFRYQLPDDVIDTDGTYKLVLQKQPGIDTEEHTVKLPGYSETLTLTKDVIFEHSLAQ